MMLIRDRAKPERERLQQEIRSAAFVGYQRKFHKAAFGPIVDPKLGVG